MKTKHTPDKIDYKNKKGEWIKVFSFTLDEMHTRYIETELGSIRAVYHKPIFTATNIQRDLPKKWIIRAYM